LQKLNKYYGGVPPFLAPAPHPEVAVALTLLSFTPPLRRPKA